VGQMCIHVNCIHYEYTQHATHQYAQTKLKCVKGNTSNSFTTHQHVQRNLKNVDSHQHVTATQEYRNETHAGGESRNSPNRRVCGETHVYSKSPSSLTAQHTMFLVHVLFSTFTCRLEQRSLTLFLQSAWRPHLLAFLSRRRHLPN
jgi:hypothetical protein